MCAAYRQQSRKSMEKSRKNGRHRPSGYRGALCFRPRGAVRRAVQFSTRLRNSANKKCRRDGADRPSFFCSRPLVRRPARAGSTSGSVCRRRGRRSFFFTDAASVSSRSRRKTARDPLRTDRLAMRPCPRRRLQRCSFLLILRITRRTAGENFSQTA